MFIIGYLLLIAGALLVLGSWILIIVIAFADELLWGLLCLIIPPVVLLYILTHFDETKIFAFAFLLGGALMKLGKPLIS